MDLVNALRPVSFEWAANTNRGAARHHGLIAQELRETFNQAHVDAGGIVGTSLVSQAGELVERYELRYHELLPFLIRALQELTDRVKTLETL